MMLTGWWYGHAPGHAALCACLVATAACGSTNEGVGGTGGDGASAGTANVGGAGNAGAQGGAAGAGGGGSGGSGAGARDLLVPDEGVWLGAFVGNGTVADTESLIQRDLAILHRYFAWSNDFVPTVADHHASGHLSLVTWEPWEDGVGISLQAIVAGDHDALVRARAADARALGVPFFLRWGHEMNGNWYPWDGFHNGAAAGGPALYVEAYRHVHDLFVEEGTENAVWVLCPNVTSVPPEPWNDWQSYYPGDEYVDWLCTDGYNWGTVQTWSSWQSFSSVMGPIIPSLASFGKPVLIAETSSTEEGGDKGAWIDGIVPALASEFPAVRGLVWFHVSKETDWRIDSSPGSLAAFIALGQAPLVNP